MIKSSTRSSITYQDPNKNEIIFFGEWTLEPKFYMPALGEVLLIRATGEKEKLSFSDKRKYLEKFLVDAKERGWDIVLDEK